MSDLIGTYSKRILLSVPFLFVLFSLALLSHHHSTDSYYDNDDFRHCQALEISRVRAGASAAQLQQVERRSSPFVALIPVVPQLFSTAADSPVAFWSAVFTPLRMLLNREIPSRAPPLFS